MSQSMALDDSEYDYENDYTMDTYEEELWRRYSSKFFLEQEQVFKRACEGYYQLLMDEAKAAHLYGKSRGFDEAFLEEDSCKSKLEMYAGFFYKDFLSGLPDTVTGQRNPNYFVHRGFEGPFERAKKDLAAHGYTLEVFHLQPFQVILHW